MQLAGLLHGAKLLRFVGFPCPEVLGQAEPLPARVVAVEAALEVAGDRGEAAARARPHADRVELEGGDAEVVDQLPEPRQVLDERRDDLPRRPEFVFALGNDDRSKAAVMYAEPGGTRPGAWATARS